MTVSRLAFLPRSSLPVPVPFPLSFARVAPPTPDSQRRTACELGAGTSPSASSNQHADADDPRCPGNLPTLSIPSSKYFVGSLSPRGVRRETVRSIPGAMIRALSPNE